MITHEVIKVRNDINLVSKPGLVGSKLDSRSRGRWFESRLIQHWMEIVSKP